MASGQSRLSIDLAVAHHSWPSAVLPPCLAESAAFAMSAAEMYADVLGLGIDLGGVRATSATFLSSDHHSEHAFLSCHLAGHQLIKALDQYSGAAI